MLQIHPELSNMVIPILDTLEKSRVQEGRKVTEDRSRDLSLNGENVDLKSLNAFLNRYSPLQLLSDRKSARRVPLGRRILSSCHYVNLASTLVVEAGSNNSEKLVELLHVDTRWALPHALWTPKHDAVLILAIAKHGWVDRETCCRAITEDPEIKWGFPFESTEKPPEEKELGEDEWSYLRSTARRASVFLENHSELIDTLKGCKRHLLIESYGLKHESKEGEDSAETRWIVDDELLLQASAKSKDGPEFTREVMDLPVKKDMAKRAKTVLQKSIAALEAGVRSAGTKDVSKSKSEEQTKSSHGYIVIDQGNRSCVLLAEMVRGIVKGSHSKIPREVRMLCSLAYEEAVALKKMFSVEEKLSSEMMKIADQIALAKMSLKTAAVPGKNILRVMLGLEPIKERNQSEALFPTEASLKEETKQSKQQNKKEPVRRDDGALGERAIIRALKKALDKNNSSPCLFEPKDDPTVGLQLTMIETLILFTFCSEGLPPIKDTASSTNATQLTWDEVASVLEIAAKDYYHISVGKLTKYRSLLEKAQSQEDVQVKKDAAKKVADAECDVSMKEEAAKLAAEYAVNTTKLAKKRYVNTSHSFLKLWFIFFADNVSESPVLCC